MYEYQPLTKREQEIAKLLKLGMGNKQISNYLFISVGTVKSHLKNLFIKTGTKNRHEFYTQYYQPLFPYTKSWNSEAISKRFTANLKKV